MYVFLPILRAEAASNKSLNHHCRVLVRENHSPTFDNNVITGNIALLRGSIITLARSGHTVAGLSISDKLR